MALPVITDSLPVATILRFGSLEFLAMGRGYDMVLLSPGCHDGSHVCPFHPPVAPAQPRHWLPTPGQLIAGAAPTTQCLGYCQATLPLAGGNASYDDFADLSAEAALMAPLLFSGRQRSSPALWER